MLRISCSIAEWMQFIITNINFGEFKCLYHNWRNRIEKKILIWSHLNNSLAYGLNENDEDMSRWSFSRFQISHIFCSVWASNHLYNTWPCVCIFKIQNDSDTIYLFIPTFLLPNSEGPNNEENWLWWLPDSWWCTSHSGKDILKINRTAVITYLEGNDFVPAQHGKVAQPCAHYRRCQMGNCRWAPVLQKFIMIGISMWFWGSLYFLIL